MRHIRENRNPLRSFSRLAKAAVAAACLSGGLVAVVSSHPVSADVGGCWGYCPGSVTWSDPAGQGWSAVDCSSGRLGIAPRASVMANYTNGEYITYRYYVTASNGYKGTSAWAAWTPAPYSRQDQSITVTTPYTPLPVTTWTVGKGLTWTVLVQFAWSTGNTTSVTSGWAAPTEGYSAGGTQRWYTYCMP